MGGKSNRFVLADEPLINNYISKHFLGKTDVAFVVPEQSVLPSAETYCLDPVAFESQGFNYLTTFAKSSESFGAPLFSMTPGSSSSSTSSVIPVSSVIPISSITPLASYSVTMAVHFIGHLCPSSLSPLNNWRLSDSACDKSGLSLRAPDCTLVTACSFPAGPGAFGNM